MVVGTVVWQGHQWWFGSGRVATWTIDMVPRVPRGKILTPGKLGVRTLDLMVKVLRDHKRPPALGSNRDEKGLK
ncbi:hypothetical protein Tco_0069904 [Tanacetum coccineum]